MVEFLITRVVTLLYMPEDVIIQQGTEGETLFLIAKGDCEVLVKDHLRQNKFVRELLQGEYFGEVSLITG